MIPETIVYAARLTLVKDLRQLTGLRVGDELQVLDAAGASCWLTATTVARLMWPSDGTPAPEAGERGGVMERRCDECAYFHGPKTGAAGTWKIGPIEIGSCRRQSPRLGCDSDYDMWPLVQPGAWCGEYKPAPERGA